MTRHRSIRLNSVFSVAGFVIPTAVILVCYPVILNGVGTEAFGVYVLATSLGGIFSFLDFGFATATVHFVAEDRARRDHRSVGETVAASLLFYGCLGSGLSLVVAALTPVLVRLFKVPDALVPAAQLALRLGALQIAFGLLTNVFVALFKGVERFHLSAASNTVLCLLSYGGAAGAVRLTGAGLRGVAAVTLIASAIVLAGTAWVSARVLASHGVALVWPRRAAFSRLLRYGSVMTVNSFAAVVVNQLPRWFIAARLGPAAVSAYTVAWSIASRVHAIVAVSSEVLFPLTSGAPSLAAVRPVYVRILWGSAAVAAAAMLPLATFPHDILRWWIGSGVTADAVMLLRTFSFAFFVLALSPAPYYVANGTGRPHWNTVFVVGHLALFLAGTTVFGFATGRWLGAVGWGLLGANIGAVGTFLWHMEREFSSETASRALA